MTILTERGQASLPASLRKEMGLMPGHRLRWQKVSSREVRLFVESGQTVAGPKAMLGFAKTFRAPRSTVDWMNDLRAGDKNR